MHATRWASSLARILVLSAVIAVSALRGRYNAKNAGAVELCAMYWYFVCAIWPFLFVLVYLT